MISYQAHIFINDKLERVQWLGQSKGHWRTKQKLKALFSELKPLAARNPQNTYYVEIRRVENL